MHGERWTPVSPGTVLYLDNDFSLAIVCRRTDRYIYTPTRAYTLSAYTTTWYTKRGDDSQLKMHVFYIWYIIFIYIITNRGDCWCLYLIISGSLYFISANDRYSLLNKIILFQNIPRYFLDFITKTLRWYNESYRKLFRQSYWLS